MAPFPRFTMVLGLQGIFPTAKAIVQAADPGAFPPFIRSGWTATAAMPALAAAEPSVECAAAAASSGGPRIFDLSLVHHEYDLMALRVAEIGPCVDYVVFVQQTARLSDGAPLQLDFPAALAAHPKVVRFVIDGNVSNGLCRTKHYPAWCRRSIGGNALGLAFDELGGGEDDWAIVSDGDEIAAPSALAWLRRLSPRQHNHSVYHLLPYHRHAVHMQCTVHSVQSCAYKAAQDFVALYVHFVQTRAQPAVSAGQRMHAGMRYNDLNMSGPGGGGSEPQWFGYVSGVCRYAHVVRGTRLSTITGSSSASIARRHRATQWGSRTPCPAGCCT